jgi:BlaI family transcriptional regulator, penicillinase repressor
MQISDAEWEVMNAVWEGQPLTAAELVTRLAGVVEWSPATIKTLVHRLVKKGALAYEEEGKRYLYRAKVTRSACVRKESRSFLDRVFGGNEAALLEHFVKSSKLSAKEIEELKRILDQQEARDE